MSDDLHVGLSSHPIESVGTSSSSSFARARGAAMASGRANTAEGIHNCKLSARVPNWLRHVSRRSLEVIQTSLSPAPRMARRCALCSAIAGFAWHLRGHRTSHERGYIRPHAHRLAGAVVRFVVSLLLTWRINDKTASPRRSTPRSILNLLNVLFATQTPQHWRAWVRNVNTEVAHRTVQDLRAAGRATAALETDEIIF